MTKHVETPSPMPDIEYSKPKARPTPIEPADERWVLSLLDESERDSIQEFIVVEEMSSLETSVQLTAIERQIQMAAARVQMQPLAEEKASVLRRFLNWFRSFGRSRGSR